MNDIYRRVRNMKGYPIQQGYKGYIPGMGYILFATQNEYEEYYNEHVNENA